MKKIEIKEEQHDMMKQMKKKDDLLERQRRIENVLSFIKFLGSLSMALDVVVKLWYIFASRFNSRNMRDLYMGFLCFRPGCLALIMIYNFMLERKKLLWYLHKKEDFV